MGTAKIVEGSPEATALWKQLEAAIKKQAEAEVKIWELVEGLADFWEKNNDPDKLATVEKLVAWVRVRNAAGQEKAKAEETLNANDLITY